MTLITEKTGGVMKLSLIIPCFNEEDCVEAFFEAANNVFSTQTYQTEYIFVNDGSSDKTLSLLKGLYVENRNINIISFSRNFGKEAAMYAGLKAAKGDYLCFIDADLQQRPELVAKMVELLEKHREYDCIAAYAKERSDESKIARFGKKHFYKIMTKISGIEFVGGASDFRCFRRNVADAILELSEYHRFTKGLFAWVGFNTRYVPYEIQERSGGESKWSFMSLFRYAFEGMVAFSNKPLHWPLYTGIVSTVFGILYLLFYIIFNIIQKQMFSEAAIVIALMFIFFGLTLTALGIIGEYIGKIHIQVKKRPSFILSENYTAKEHEKNAPVLQKELEREAAELKKLKIKKAKFKEMKRKQQIMEQLVARQELEREAEQAQQEAEAVEENKAPKKVKPKRKKKAAPDEEEIYTTGPESGFEDE